MKNQEKKVVDEIAQMEMQIKELKRKIRTINKALKEAGQDENKLNEIKDLFD